MGILRALLTVVEIVVGLLLIGVILIQKSRDEGLGMAFGVGVGETLFGSRAGNVLTRITVGLAIVFLFNTLLIAITYTRGSAATGSVVDRLPAERTPPVQQAPTGPLPAAPGGGDTIPATPAPVPEAPVAPAVPQTAPAPAGGAP